MKAIQVTQTGGPEVLTLVDLPAPTPKANEALSEIKSAGINFIDVYIREGRYPSPLPFIAGQEAAGIVTDVGAEVKNIKAVIASPSAAHLGAMPNIDPGIIYGLGNGSEPGAIATGPYPHHHTP